MAVTLLQIVGWAALIVGTLLIGRWLRQRRDKATAERCSRVMQGLFFAGLVIPAGLGLFYPGYLRRGPTYLEYKQSVPFLIPRRAK
jgi:hypothetical protein